MRQPAPTPNVTCRPLQKRVCDRPVWRAQAVVLRACHGQTAGVRGAAGPRRGPSSSAGAAGGAAGPRTRRAESRPRPLLLCCHRARAGPRSPPSPRCGPTATSAPCRLGPSPLLRPPAEDALGLTRTRRVPRKRARTLTFVPTPAGPAGRAQAGLQRALSALRAWQVPLSAGAPAGAGNDPHRGRARDAVDL